jgi:hypothetical protein
MGHRRGGFDHKHLPNFQRNPLRTREAVPDARRTKDGAQILCPFCKPSHPLSVGESSPCGTQLKLTAVQQIIPSRIVRMNKLVCVKCRQSGGEMVKYMNGFIHLQDCNPGTNLLRAQPHYNTLAGLVFKLPKTLRRQVAKVTGSPQQVREITPDGTETGKIAGYFFLKGKSDVTGQTPEPTAS